VSRILFFSRDYTTHDHRFLSALAKTDHQVYFLRLERGPNQLEDRPLPPDIEQVAWIGGTSPARVQDGIRLLVDLKRVIREVKPDLIQAGPIQRSAFLVALSSFNPLISMSWGYDLIHDANRNIFWRWATRFTLRRSAMMVGDCDTIRQLAIAHGMQDERIVTFPWGVDLEHFSPSHNGRGIGTEKEGGNAFTLLSTRSWEPIYGIDLIAKAFSKAAVQNPTLQLVMLGNGSLAPRLRQIFKNSGVEDKVIFPGQVSQSELPRFYRNADLYLSASHSDGTSISLLEAMACGKPVIVSDIPGNREWVKQGENGWLFSDGDADHLEQAILSAASQHQNLPEMGHTARRIAEERANWEANFQELLKAYRRVL